MNSIGEFNVSISSGGQKLRIYQKEGRYFVAGEPGQPYAIEVYNPKGQRIEVLESVDGRNVLQDEPASFANRGMIVSPHSLWRNGGWRIDDDHVREFMFGSPSESIAAQATGSAGGVGVIGIAIFTEKPYRVTYSSYNSSWNKGASFRSSWSSESSVRGLSGQATASGDEGQATSDYADLGTGMGDERADHVGRTTFERIGPIPHYTVEIQYRTHAWLVAHNIITEEYGYPSAWPGGTTGYQKYVK